jgi:hypothetical protein
MPTGNSVAAPATVGELTSNLKATVLDAWEGDCSRAEKALLASPETGLMA